MLFKIGLFILYICSENTYYFTKSRFLCFKICGAVAHTRFPLPSRMLNEIASYLITKKIIIFGVWICANFHSTNGFNRAGSAISCSQVIMEEHDRLEHLPRTCETFSFTSYSKEELGERYQNRKHFIKLREWSHIWNQDSCSLIRMN